MVDYDAVTSSKSLNGKGVVRRVFLPESVIRDIRSGLDLKTKEMFECYLHSKQLTSVLARCVCLD